MDVNSSGGESRSGRRFHHLCGLLQSGVRVIKRGVEGSTEIGVDLEIFGLTRFPTEEEDIQVRWVSMERDEGPHRRWVRLLADKRGEMGKDLDHN